MRWYRVCGVLLLVPLAAQAHIGHRFTPEMSGRSDRRAHSEATLRSALTGSAQSRIVPAHGNSSPPGMPFTAWVT